MDQSPLGLAERIAVALRATAPSGAAFHVRPMGEIAYGSGRSAGVATIHRIAENKLEAVLDIYALNDVPDLVAEFHRRSMLSRLGEVVLQLGINVSRVSNLRTADKGSTTKAILLLWASMALFLLFVQFIILGVSLLTVLLHSVTTLAPGGISLVADSSAVPAAIAASLLASVNLYIVPLFPQSLRASVADAASGWLVVIGYLNGRYNSEDLTQGITSLVDELSGHADPHAAVHLVGFSFGTVLLLDAVFRVDTSPPPRLADLNSVTTIGCPLDALSVFWPDHFTGRRDSYSMRTNWTNVSIEGDPISSRVLDRNGKRGVASRSDGLIRPHAEVTQRDWNRVVRVGAIRQLLFAGFRLHTSYWGRRVNEPGCWLAIVPRILRDDPIYAGSG